MRKLLNKYYNLIGIQNEGYKRLLIVSFFITPFIYYPLITDSRDNLIDEIFWSSGRYIYEDFVITYLFLILISILLNGFIFKIYIWIKEGFSKN